LTGHRKKLIVAGSLAVVVVVLYASGVLPSLPDPKKAIEDIAVKLGRWTYVLVGLLAFLETGAFVGLVAPGETTVIVGGVIAGQGEIGLIPLIGVVWACCVAGDTASFFLGRRLGRSFLERNGPRVGIDERRMSQVDTLFERHGGKTILIGRFIGFVRAVAPFIAGTTKLPYRRFLPFSVLGSGLWASVFALLGYLFWQSFDQVAAIAGRATFAFGFVVAAIVLGIYAFRRLRDPAARRRMASWIEGRPVIGVAWRRAVVPAARVVGRPVRAVARHVTLEALGLISALGAAGVGLYVFTLYAITLDGGRETMLGDEEVLDLAERLESSAAVDVVKVVTDLGAFPTVVTLVAAVGTVLVLRGHRTEALSLLVGGVLVYVAVQLAKTGVDRPRPDDTLTETRGSAYPSGHAAYSTLWVAAAVALARVVRGLVSSAALVGAGVAVAVLVGLSRVYLRVHWWSDVVGGWALGAGLLSAVAAVALVVVHMRHNGRAREASQGQI
jgi:membrane protein DedA with SNARE-associated domain/membrane-associated phospholipid phosphatase